MKWIVPAISEQWKTIVWIVIKILSTPAHPIPRQKKRVIVCKCLVLKDTIRFQKRDKTFESSLFSGMSCESSGPRRRSLGRVQMPPSRTDLVSHYCKSLTYFDNNASILRKWISAKNLHPVNEILSTSLSHFFFPICRQFQLDNTIYNNSVRIFLSSLFLIYFLLIGSIKVSATIIR